jgi:CRISPR/Cas system-associated exonuclease Cas4 (RecB family)
MHNLAFVVVVILIVFMMYVLLKNEKKQAGIKGWVVNQDLDNKSKRIYRDKNTGISCKPDVVEHNRIIEVKSAKVMGKARYSDILQVAAQLIATGKKKAELSYADGKRFNFEKTGKVMKHAMKRVDGISKRMRWHLLTRIAPKGTPTPNKCAACMFKQECSDAIWS